MDQAAADWFARKKRGLSPEESTEFQRWLQADPRHAKTIDELERLWLLMDRLSEVRLPDGHSLDALLPPPAASRRSWFRAVAVTGMAAALLIGIWFARAGLRSSTEYTGHVVTEIGKIERKNLPDGSVVCLNTDTELDISYSAGERRLDLRRGEANFKVTKDAARPFVVYAHGTKIRAVGTVFDVRLHAEAVQVLVSEGTVGVRYNEAGSSSAAPGDSEPPTLMVTAGNQAVVPLAHSTVDSVKIVTAVPISAATVNRELAWQEGKLEFESVPLSQVVADFNRYNRHQLIIAEPSSANRMFGGSIRIDNSDAFVRLLEVRFGFRAERHEDHTVLYPAR